MNPTQLRSNLQREVWDRHITGLLWIAGAVLIAVLVLRVVG